MSTTRKQRYFIPLALGLALLVIGASAVAYFAPLDPAQWRRKLYSETPKLYRAIKETIQNSDREIPLVSQSRHLPLLHLTLSQKDMAHFAALYRKLKDKRFGVAVYAKENQWRKAKLNYNGQTYKIFIKAHGKEPSGHKVGQFISYAVKLRDGQQLWKATRFSLLIRDRIQPDRHVSLATAQRFGVYSQDLRLVRILINNVEEKLYYFEPRYDDRYMEAKNLASHVVFRSSYSDTISSDKTMIFTSPPEDEQYFSPTGKYRQEFEAMFTDRQYPEAHREAILARHLALNRTIAAGDDKTIEAYFDLDYITAFEAVRTVLGYRGHGLVRGNLHMSYDLASGRFYPWVTDDLDTDPLTIPEGQAPEYQINHYKGDPLTLFILLSRNDRIRQEKYKKIYDLIMSDGETIGKSHRDILESYDKLHYFGWVKLLLRRAGLSPFPTVTGQNLKWLKRYLEDAAPQITLFTGAENTLIEITPGSMAGLRLTHLAITGHRDTPSQSARGLEARLIVSAGGRVSDAFTQSIEWRGHTGVLDLSRLFDGVVLANTLDDGSNLLPRKYTVHVPLGSVALGDLAADAVNVQLVNDVTGQVVSPVKVRLERLEADRLSQLATVAFRHRVDAFEAWQARHSDLHVSRSAAGELIIHPGTYYLYQDVYFPKDMKLVLEAGTTLLLGENVALVGYRGIDIQGTAEQPVTIAAIDPAKPFGTVGILGGPDTTCDIRYLRLRNGRERWADGAFFLGGLSLYYHGVVTVLHSEIADNAADDGLNIKYARRVHLAHNTFRGNFADQVDLDYVEGIVTENVFEAAEGRDSNGDGLDISGSHALVFRNHFRNLGDKGISVGEDSRALVFDNVIGGNKIGVAAKDLSEVYLLENRFMGNGVDVSVYQKKKTFGGALAILDPMSVKAGGVVYEFDAHSRVEVFPEALPPLRSALALSDGAAHPVRTILAKLRTFWAGTSN